MSETFGDTVRRLAAAQKGRARGAPAYSIYVNRPAGRVLAAALYRLGALPNQVTGLSAVCTFTAVLALAVIPGSLAMGLLVWLLLALGYALDSADGQVARLRGGGSLAGEWLDHFIDAIKVIALHLAVAIGIFRFVDVDDLILLIPLCFALVSGVTFFGMILNDLIKGKVDAPAAASSGGSTPMRSLLMLPTDYGLLCFIFIAWGLPAIFISIYSMLFLANFLFLILAACKWYREMKLLDRGMGR